MTEPRTDRHTSCIRCRTALDEGDLRCAVCALPVPVIEHRHYRTVYPQVLRCTECAAAITFVPAARAPRCAFCGATMAIEQPHDPIERAERRVPFAVSRETATAALRGWLATRGPFAPGALRTDAVLETLAPMYWAAWIVSAQAAVSWAADSDHDARRSAWAPHAGETTLRFDALCISASKGLTSAECAVLGPSYDLALTEPLGEEPPGDGVVEGFEAQRSAARAQIQRALDAQAAAQVRPLVPGTRIRNLHVASLLESQTTQRLGLPAWIVTYRYRDRRYRAVVHGQRPDVVIGRAPVDPWRIFALVMVVVAMVLALIALTGCEATDPPPPDAPVVSDAADAPPIDGPAVEASCEGSFAYSRTEAEAQAALEALLADVQAQAPGAYYVERIDGTTQAARLGSVNATLAAPLDSDPRMAAIAWLAATSPGTFRASEWAVDPTEPPFDPSATYVASRFIRTAVDDLPWPNDYPNAWVRDTAVYMFIDQRAEGWSLRDVTVAPTTVLATREDARLLAACRPTLPGSETALRAMLVTGNEFDNCLPTGTYDYTPHATDTTTWLPGQGWELLDPVAGQRTWQPAVVVNLRIDPANYWPRIDYSDCICDGNAGFTYRIDPVTGEILQIIPGIECVVC